MELHEFIEQQGNVDNTLSKILLHNTCNLVKTKLLLERRTIGREKHSISTLSMLMWQLFLNCPLETRINPGGQVQERQDNAINTMIEGQEKVGKA